MRIGGFVENRLYPGHRSLAPVHRGIGTALAALVLAVGSCLVLPAEARACQSAGQSCSFIDGGSCCDGLSCGPPGWEICYDVPRQLEQPCSASGDDRCAEGLSCHPGIPQRCYNEPRQAGQPCDVNHACGDRGFVCHPLLLRCVLDEALDPFDDASCAVFYDQNQADAALDLGSTLSHGIGGVGGTVLEGSTQVGVVYGANGEFGCFETHCVGSAPDVSGAAFYMFGVMKDWPSFAGTSLVKPGEASGPFLEIGFETAQVWAPNFAELLGAANSVSVGGGFLPEGDGFLTCDTVVNEIECPTELRTDSDGDGVLDCYDGCPNDAAKTEEGRCQCGVADSDSDGDLAPDCVDDCPDDPSKSSAGQCGCGNPDVDADDDGRADCADECPDDPFKIEPGVCGCGIADDADNDGAADCADACPGDITKTEPGTCGCGTPEPATSSSTPILTCEDGQAECAGALTAVTTHATAVDQCGRTLVTSVDDGGPYPLGATTVAWSATDAEGGTGMCQATALVLDTTNPTARCQGDIRECTGELTAVTMSCTATDACDAEVDVMSSAHVSYAPGSHTFTCTATDASGNTDTTSCDVVVRDTLNPTAACTGDTRECTGELTAVTTSCTGTDACDTDLDAHSTAASSYPPGSSGFQCTVADDAGNTDTTSCDVVIRDTARPTATCTGDVRECAGALTAVTTSCTGTDVCDAQPDVHSTAAPSYPLGTSHFACTVSDDAGNVDTTSCAVAIRDTVRPTAACTGDIQECTGALTAVATSCTGTDVCDAQPDVHSTAAPSYPLGTSRFACTVSDDAGNVRTTSCDVVIVDTTWPIVECAGETVECTANQSAEATVTGSAADVCDGDVDITGTGTASYALGFHTVQVIGTDDAGNATSCDATVIVEDTTTPRITATAGDDVYECGEDYVEHGATAFDICDGDLSGEIVTDASHVDTSTPTSTPSDPNDTPYVVHYSVVDGSGNRSTTSRDVTVLRYFSGDGGLLWDEPLPDSASGPDHTDPSGLATTDPADDYKFPFTQNRTIPVKVRVLNKWGTDVTADPSISATLSVYADANCDLAPEGDAVDIDDNGVGGPGGLMQLAGAHLHYNLATKDWPGKHDGCFILEATASVTGACDDSHTERVWLQRKR